MNNNKKQLTTYNALVKFVKSNPCFEINNDRLFCNVCNIAYTYNANEGVRDLKRHITTECHKRAINTNKMQSRLQLTKKNESYIYEFHTELLDAFVSANIPLHKLENSALRGFIEKYTGVNIKSISHFRDNLVEKRYLHQKEKIFEILRSGPIYLIFDETTDSKGRYIFNVLAGLCSSDKRKTPFLVKTIEIITVNAATVNSELISLLSCIYGNDMDRLYNVKMVLSDGAPYAKKAGEMLQMIVPNIKRVICVCHNLHNLCKSIKNNSSNLNNIISFMKKILVKNRSNQQNFVERTGLCIPKFPILTRWGTWMEFSKFVFENFDFIRGFLLSLSPDKHSELAGIIEIIDSWCLENELRIVYDHSFIPEAILKLESAELSVEEQIQILKDVIHRVEEKSLFYDRLKDILRKNPDITFFMKFNMLKAPQNEKFYSYVPLTTVDVERSFSAYRYILDDRRQNLKIVNIERLLALYYNKLD